MNTMFLRLTDNEAILLLNALDSFISEQNEIQKSNQRAEGDERKINDLINRSKGLQVRIERLKKL